MYHFPPPQFSVKKGLTSFKLLSVSNNVITSHSLAIQRQNILLCLGLNSWVEKGLAPTAGLQNIEHIDQMSTKLLDLQVQLLELQSISFQTYHVSVRHARLLTRVPYLYCIALLFDVK